MNSKARISNSANSLVFCAHPGHEVLVHGWLEKLRPKVLILTDGSGRSGQPRIESTRSYLTELGTSYGSIFGGFTDRQMYEAILRQDFVLFEKIVREVGDLLIEDNIDWVVGDSAEGYNSVHDVCRLLINCAVARASALSGRPIRNLDFPVVNGPAAKASHNHESVLRLDLDEASFRRKLAAGRKYFPELTLEVEQAFAGTGVNSHREFLETTDYLPASGTESVLEAFRTEYIATVAADFDYENEIENSPFYERRGEQRAFEGDYKEVIRFSEHMVPIAKALTRYAASLFSHQHHA